MEEADLEKKETPDVGRQMESAGKVLTKDFVLVILKWQGITRMSQLSVLHLLCCVF